MANPTFQTLSTPDPSEMAFRVRIEGTGIFPSQLPKQYTIFKKCTIIPAKPRATHQDLGSYVYTRFQPDGDYLWLYFMKPKTDAEKLIPFREYWSGDQPPTWPAVLRRVSPVQDVNTPLSFALASGDVSNAARNYVTVDLIPPTPGGRVLIREYLSPTQHNCSEPVGPVPTAVNWDIPGVNDMYSCLHDDIYVPAVSEGGLIKTGTEARGMALVGSGEFFPATEMKQWEVYTESDGERPLPDGGWHRIERICYPPDTPPVSTRDKL